MGYVDKTLNEPRPQAGEFGNTVKTEMFLLENLKIPTITHNQHITTKGDSTMAEEKEYGLLIAAIVAIVSIVGLVILFSRGAPVGKVVTVSGGPGSFQSLPEQARGALSQNCQEINGEKWCRSPEGILKQRASDYGYSPEGELSSDRATWS